MIFPDRAKLQLALRECKLVKSQTEIIQLLDEKYANPKHGHFNEWLEIFKSLPSIEASTTELDKAIVKIGHADDVSSQQRKELEQKFKLLCPWRKGPFEIFGIYIDSEWRSDWKWSRIEPHINLQGKVVLDIGCGNGYYALRMQGRDASLVLGVDPSWHYTFQFHGLQRYSSVMQQAFVLPLAFEEFIESSCHFDVIFSMGVLYHRKEPTKHLNQIHKLLNHQGQLVLETLIIDAAGDDILIPKDRYANMRNVWMIPNSKLLKTWLKKAGFKNIDVINTSMTTIEEQRQTEWMTRYSLAHALNLNNPKLTIEGYQSPTRTIVIAEK